MHCEGYDGSEDCLRVARTLPGPGSGVRIIPGPKGRSKKSDETVTAWRVRQVRYQSIIARVPPKAKQ